MMSPERSAVASVIAALPVAAILVGCGVEAQTMNGTYSVATPAGALTMSLTVSSSGAVVGWLLDPSGGVSEIEGVEGLDDEGDLTVEATLRGSMAAELTMISEDDGTFALVITPFDAGGVPQALGTLVHVGTRTSELPASLPEVGIAGTAGAPRPGGSPDAGSRTDAPPDPPGEVRLVGMWSTQVVMNSDVGSVAVQTFMELTPEGILRDLGSRGMGGFGDGSIDTGLGNGGEEALWRTQGDLLLISLSGSPWVPLARFAFSDGRLVLLYLQDGSRQIWSRH